MAFTHILEPIMIGTVEVPNRVVRTAHGTGIGGGTFSDDLIAYHLERAHGGVGLTILEILSVHPTSLGTLNAFDPSLVESYGKLMEQVRPTGMRVFQQVWHAGHNGVDASGGPPWSASEIASPTVGVVPVAMTQAMIDEIVGAFAAAARKCEEGGLDGVEIHCAHGYLLHQFLSPSLNRREDDYGGCEENRQRLMLEVVRAVRGAVGPGFAVGVRVAPDLTENGVGVGECERALAALEREGLVDFVNISLGNYHSFPKMIGGMHEPVGYEMPTSAPIARRSKVPAIVTGRFRTLEEADQVIRAGEADLVGMTRATIADPELVRKTIAGRIEDVRPCIACNQRCAGGVLGPARRMGCSVNVAVGFERTLSEKLIERSADPMRVVVVGGGPAGLEAARVAALRGHNVILFEASKDLGGTIAIAKRAPTRHGIADITAWLERQVYALGVDVRLMTPVDADDIRAEEPGAVIVATGSEPRMDGIQLSHPGEPARGMDRSNVYSTLDIFTRPDLSLGNRAVVVDDVGHYEGLATAEHLLARGLGVEFVTRHASPAPLMEPALMVTPALERMAGKDITFRTRTRLVAVGDNLGTVQLQSVHGGGPFKVHADSVVFISHNRPRRDLVDSLADLGAPVIAVGGAASPRYLENAIYDGHMAARGL
ncbi:MAG TPA: FAD-dependent oxidoreductase [Hyphomicrobiaceae bacterium]|nr:FAD-dependent oxidoreductase [Hyphomicrobiaceae bacterium]